MAVQMYIVQVKNDESDSDRVAVAECIAGIQGFILMATSAGSLIAAFDEQFADAVRAHPTVDFVGGVSFNPDGPLIEHFQRLFAQNIASQLAEQGRPFPGQDVQAPGGRPSPDQFPPGYRPLRWQKFE